MVSYFSWKSLWSPIFWGKLSGGTFAKKRKGSGARTTTKNVYSTEPHKKKKLPGEFKISRNNHIGKARPPTLRRSVSEMELKVQRGGVSRGGESRGGESRGMQSRGLHTPRKEARGASLSPRGRVNRKSLESDSKTSGEKKKGRWLVDDLWFISDIFCTWN